MITILMTLGFLLNDPILPEEPPAIASTLSIMPPGSLGRQTDAIQQIPRDKQVIPHPIPKVVKRVYIASYPRCGNKWTRSLIEEATGITTAYSFLGFKQAMQCISPWGAYVNSNYEQKGLRLPDILEPLVIKTHFPVYHNQPLGDVVNTRVVRLVRHPVDSFYSEYVLSLKGTRRKPAFQMPRYFLHKAVFEWIKFQKYWNQEPNVLTIRYEDLFTDPVNNLRRILEFAGYEFTEEDLERAVRKYPPEGSLLKHMNHFTQSDLLLIQRELGQLMLEYGYEISQVNSLN